MQPACHLGTALLARVLRGAAGGIDRQFCCSSRTSATARLAVLSGGGPCRGFDFRANGTPNRASCTSIWPRFSAHGDWHKLRQAGQIGSFVAHLAPGQTSGFEDSPLARSGGSGLAIEPWGGERRGRRNRREPPERQAGDEADTREGPAKTASLDANRRDKCIGVRRHDDRGTTPTDRDPTGSGTRSGAFATRKRFFMESSTIAHGSHTLKRKLITSPS
jgi:hypothetical protein